MLPVSRYTREAPIPRLAPLAVFEPERASGETAGDWGTRESGARERVREEDPHGSGARKRSSERLPEPAVEEGADDGCEPLARSKMLRMVATRLAIGAVVASVLLATFAVARAVTAPDAEADAREGGAAAGGASSLSAAAVGPVAPAEKRAGPAPGGDDVSGSALPDPELDVALARAERWEVRAALELGDLRRAIDVGERAVRHDPSEADGWLLLAAAHMNVHDEHAANRALAAHSPRTRRVREARHARPTWRVHRAASAGDP